MLFDALLIGSIIGERCEPALVVIPHDLASARVIDLADDEWSVNWPLASTVRHSQRGLFVGLECDLLR